MSRVRNRSRSDSAYQKSLARVVSQVPRVTRAEAYKAGGAYFAGVSAKQGYAYRIDRNGRTWYATALSRPLPPGYGYGVHYLVAFVLPSGDIFEAAEGLTCNDTAQNYLNRWVEAFLAAEDDGTEWPEGIAAEVRARSRTPQIVAEWVEWED